MARGKPLQVVKPKPSGKFSQHQAKPCPTCYAPMGVYGGVLKCIRHGEPTRP